jgi:anti-sigma regulatory factor (Ser/Thr protein kinase)
MHPPRLRHQALLYESTEDYVDAVAGFVDDGRRSGEPALVAVPGPHLHLLQMRLGETEGVALVDMRELGRNPGRIIPAIREFVDAHEGEHVRFVGEPIWHGRSESETLEAARHESLINLAFADSPATILCPYDAWALGEDVLDYAERTHPEVLGAGACRPSTAYTDPASLPIVTDPSLPPPRGPVSVLAFDTDLAAVRAFVRAQAGAILDEDRLADLVLAVNEAVANTVEHARAAGTVRIWQDADDLVCEVNDPGHIADLLADRRFPTPYDARGRGLWLVNQLCDLVQLRSSPAGTVIRLHMSTR